MPDYLFFLIPEGMQGVQTDDFLSDLLMEIGIIRMTEDCGNPSCHLTEILFLIATAGHGRCT